MQCYLCKTNPLYLATLDKFVTEMQTCSWCGHCPFMFCINGLITFFVFFIRLAFNIFWQRSFAQKFKHLLKACIITIPQKTNGTTAARCVVNYFGNKLVVLSEIQFISNTDFS